MVEPRASLDETFQNLGPSFTLYLRDATRPYSPQLGDPLVVHLTRDPGIDLVTVSILRQLSLVNGKDLRRSGLGIQLMTGTKSSTLLGRSLGKVADSGRSAITCRPASSQQIKTKMTCLNEVTAIQALTVICTGLPQVGIQQCVVIGMSLAATKLTLRMTETGERKDVY